MNAVLSWVNYAKTGVLYTNYESSSSMSVSNLIVPHRAVRWRALATAAYVQVDLGSVKPVNLVMLTGLNLTATATWRIRLSNVALGAGDVYDSGVVTMGTIPGFNQAAWFDEAGYNARYVDITISDTTNPDGYLEAGLLWVGNGWQPSKNISYGFSHGFVDESTVSKSRGGQTFVDVRSRYRSAEFVLEFLSEAEVYNNLFELDRLNGLVDNVVFLPDPAGAFLGRQAILGRVTEMSPIVHPLFEQFSKRYKIEERL